MCITHRGGATLPTNINPINTKGTMKAKDNVKMIGHLGGAVVKIGRLKKASEGKITGHLGEKMHHKVKERLVYDGLNARVVDILPE